MHVNDAQREEIEALEAILGDDFSLQQDETTRRPLIKLDFSEERPKVQFSLYLCLPPSYPEDSPSMTIQPAPMIFELYMKTKDWLLEQEKEDEAEDIDRVSCVGSVPSVNENTKLESSLLIHSLIEEEYGTPVTKETFEKWRQSFFQEFGLSLRNKERETAWKLTGRQLFEENRLVETSETYVEPMFQREDVYDRME
ncbi:hypothetical protein Gasu2_52790 [Galdieria sulphuraria]|nr:hypothetical protein Gasu2_52790 [Galdieria sulphuraria]